MHLQAAQDKIIGELASDQTGTQNRDRLTFTQPRPQNTVIRQIIDRANGIGARPGHWHVSHFGAHCQDQLRVGQFFMTDGDEMSRRFNSRDPGVYPDVDIELFGHFTGLRHDQLISGLILGKSVDSIGLE